MFEDKAGFVRELGELLRKYSRENISHMEYEEKENVEAVIAHFRNGYSKAVDVTGDSCLGIMTDLACRLS
jgi:hypothetical protein